MKIGNLSVYLDTGSGLVIRKNKNKKILSVLGFILIPVAGIIIILLFSERTTTTSLDGEAMFWAISCAIIILSGFFFNVRRLLRRNRDYVIKVDEGKIFINSVLFCEKDKLDHVLIQPVSGSEGIGESFTVGLTSGKSFYPITFDKNIYDAKTLSAIIADYIGTGIVSGETVLFPDARGY